MKSINPTILSKNANLFVWTMLGNDFSNTNYQPEHRSISALSEKDYTTSV